MKLQNDEFNCQFKFCIHILFLYVCTYIISASFALFSTKMFFKKQKFLISYSVGYS